MFSKIVEYELRDGLLRLPGNAATSRLAALVMFLQHLQILPFDSESATQAAGIRAGLEALGTPIGVHDTH